MTALRLDQVAFCRDGGTILRDIDWQVQEGERWVVLGANGSGKTTLIRIAGMWEHPSSGIVEVLGGRLGSVDVRRHRERVGFVSPAFADLLRPNLVARDVVMTGRTAALEPWWHEYSDDDRRRAADLLNRVGCGHVADHAFGTLSSGERQRVLLARSLVADVGLLLLDEPTAGLDLPGREALVATLGDLAADASAPPMVLVTHHLEEIPPGFDHVLLLSDGAVAAAGPIHDTLTSAALSECLGIPLEVGTEAGRWWARALRPPL